MISNEQTNNNGKKQAQMNVPIEFISNRKKNYY